MNPFLAKIRGDLSHNRVRTLFLALSVLIGVAALATALGARSILHREIRNSYESGQPASVILYTDHVSPEVLEIARQCPGVLEADSRRLVRTRVEVSPGDWRPLLLFAIRDFSDITVSKIFSVSGAKEPPVGSALVERSAVPVVRAAAGESLRVRTLGGKVCYSLRISGIVYDPAMAPGWQDNAGYAYVTPETLARVGVGQELDELRLSLEGERDAASRVAQLVAKRIADEGHKVSRIEVLSREHPHADHMQTVLTILLCFASLALALSGALSANIFSALIARQTRQVGIMKVIGARSPQILRIYLSLVLTVVIPGTVIGVPLGVLVARRFSAFAAGQMNIDIESFAVPIPILLFVTVLGIAVPVAAALVPLCHATRLKPIQAFSDVYKPISSPAHRLRLPTTFSTLALRNLVRRPTRLLLTLTALSLGGVSLMIGLNVNCSLIGAVDLSLAQRSDTLEMRTLVPMNAEELASRLDMIPQVEVAEVWGGVLAGLSFSEQNSQLSSQRYGVLAPPETSRLLTKPPLAEGKWPTQLGEIAINRSLLAREPSVRVGSVAFLVSGSNRVPVRTVGLVEEVAEPHLYVTQETHAALVGRNGTAGIIRVKTSPGAEQKVAAQLESVVSELGSLPVFSMTRSQLRASLVDHFRIMLTLLTAASTASLIVGVLSLTTTLAISVVERKPEIAVMRALGASRKALIALLLLEGFFVVGLSFLISIVISLPLTAAVADLVGRHGLHAVIPFRVSGTGIGVWCAVSVITAVVACLGPAREMMRLTVSDILRSAGGWD